MKRNDNYYYNIVNDLEKYNAWCYLVVGGRNTGKTYSALKAVIDKNIKFVFVKRTIEDVDLLTAGSGKIGSKQNEYGIDLSPFKAINRDMNTNIKAFSIKKGLGGFWRCELDEEGNEHPVGNPIGYLIALNAVSKFKGFDLSDASWIIFDEFIPQPWERVSRLEGEQLMDLYKTVARDREHRGYEELKLLCLANATAVSNPITNILEVVDNFVDMQLKNENVLYIEERGILLRLLNDNLDFQEKEKQSRIYKAMSDTNWGKMAFDNKFAYNDFTNVGKLSLKNFLPVVKIRYKTKYYFVYQKEGMYYMTKSQNNTAKLYNLNLENDQKKFYIDYCIDLRHECIDGNMIFESYSMYDLIINYKHFFKI